MKQIKLAVIALFTLVAINVNAQDSDNPWGVGFGVNTVDLRAYTEDFGTNISDYIGTEEWSSNTLPSISRISVDKYLNDGFSLQLAGSINKLEILDGNRLLKSGETDADALYWSIDALVKYDLNNLFGETGWFDPYVGIGGSYQELDGNGDGVLSGAWGFNTWFNDNLGLNFQSAYKHGFESTGRDVFQHSLGLVFKFGGKDTDGDGIYDKDDACPEVAGIAEFNGCPDTDGDGIKDSDDACPTVAGIAAMNGCPDRDGDGIKDSDDACPDVKGTRAMRGCPDTDGDGVTDASDNCPKVAGPKENKGCPWADTDKDGVFDKDDKCPKVPGVASNNGCPAKPVEVITKDAETAIGAFARTILFNTNKSTFKPGVVETLNGIAKIMKDFPNANFAVEGHTDSQGRASTNMSLSDRRANAVMNFLVSQGISNSRLSARGFGEDAPIDTNATRAGRANNRRVEVRVTNR